MVAFPIVGDPDKAAFVAWTTTPWTLPSNFALCVNANFSYVKVSYIRLFSISWWVEMEINFWLIHWSMKPLSLCKAWGLPYCILMMYVMCKKVSANVSCEGQCFVCAFVCILGLCKCTYVSVHACLLSWQYGDFFILFTKCIRVLALW